MAPVNKSELNLSFDMYFILKCEPVSVILLEALPTSPEKLFFAVEMWDNILLSQFLTFLIAISPGQPRT